MPIDSLAPDIEVKTVWAAGLNHSNLFTVSPPLGRNIVFHHRVKRFRLAAATTLVQRPVGLDLLLRRLRNCPLLGCFSEGGDLDLVRADHGLAGKLAVN